MAECPVLAQTELDDVDVMWATCLSVVSLLEAVHSCDLNHSLPNLAET